MPASGSLNSAVLGLVRTEVASFDIRNYNVDLDIENAIAGNRDIVDGWAGMMTGSCFSMFQISGSTSDNLGDAGGLGAEFNRACDRVIQEVVAFAATSGSGGVSTIDILTQPAPGAAFVSIFGPAGSANNVFKVALSSSLGNYGIARSGQTNMVSGSNMVWKAGTLLKAQLTTAAGAAGVSGQKGLIVQVFWSPSGSASGRSALP